MQAGLTSLSDQTTEELNKRLLMKVDPRTLDPPSSSGFEFKFKSDGGEDLERLDLGGSSSSSSADRGLLVDGYPSDLPTSVDHRINGMVTAVTEQNGKTGS